MYVFMFLSVYVFVLAFVFVRMFVLVFVAVCVAIDVTAYMCIYPCVYVVFVSEMQFSVVAAYDGYIDRHRMSYFMSLCTFHAYILRKTGSKRALTRVYMHTCTYK